MVISDSRRGGRGERKGNGMEGVCNGISEYVVVWWVSRREEKRSQSENGQLKVVRVRRWRYLFISAYPLQWMVIRIDEWIHETNAYIERRTIRRKDVRVFNLSKFFLNLLLLQWNSLDSTWSWQLFSSFLPLFLNVFLPLLPIFLLLILYLISSDSFIPSFHFRRYTVEGRVYR